MPQRHIRRTEERLLLSLGPFAVKCRGARRFCRRADGGALVRGQALSARRFDRVLRGMDARRNRQGMGYRAPGARVGQLLELE